MKYMVSSLDRPNNTPIYSIHSDLDSFIFYNENDLDEKVNEECEVLGTLQQSIQSLYDEFDSQNYHDPETPQDNKTELDFLQIENEMS